MVPRTFWAGEPTHYERPLALIAELHIWYADGTTETICTDESWQYRKSFTTLSDIYNGETQDYGNWQAESWKESVLIKAPGKLCARYSSALHDMEHLPVKEVIHTPAGETVLDFGQNFAGHVVCTQPIPQGITMTLEFGEILQEGNFYHENYRHAESRFTYVSDGVPREIRPRFTFFGFRYVKVSGFEQVDASCFEGRAIYSEMDQIGFIKTENPKINQLFSNSLWGLKSNFVDMPTDCPQRDERLGWTGDAQVFCTTAGYHMDTRAFYHKFLRDLRSDQKRNDGLRHYLPNAFPGLTAVLSDVAAFMPKCCMIIMEDKLSALSFNQGLGGLRLPAGLQQGKKICMISDSSLVTGWHWTEPQSRVPLAGRITAMCVPCITGHPQDMWQMLPRHLGLRKYLNMRTGQRISKKRF